MNPILLRSERLIPADPSDVRLARNVSTWEEIVASVTSPDYIALVMVCLIGLLTIFALDFVSSASEIPLIASKTASKAAAETVDSPLCNFLRRRSQTAEMLKNANDECEFRSSNIAGP